MLPEIDDDDPEYEAAAKSVRDWLKERYSDSPPAARVPRPERSPKLSVVPSPSATTRKYGDSLHCLDCREIVQYPRLRCPMHAKARKAEQCRSERKKGRRHSA